ncbi:MAG: Rne/Rng family ribonuclease [Deltaproteobacteria bacterium]|nr:Rne/Rng family ribonuclease [Deltaproteobacteria bacterium]
MRNLILINHRSYETRVAIIENDQLVELHLERRSEKGLVGNVYKGEVIRVLPGMQAAFVDIGLERSAFLYVSDVVPDNLLKKVEESVCMDVDFDEMEECEERFTSRRISIESMVREGDNILVQIVKEPISTKGARLTTNVTLPGRYVVFMPTIDHIGVSHKITNPKERERLRGILEKHRPKNTGFIARTNAEGEKEINIIADMELLVELWNNILKKYEKSSARECIYQEFSLPFKIIRDYCNESVDSVIIDEYSLYKDIREFIQLYMPFMSRRIKYFDEQEALFEAFGIENAISRLFARKVWLRSGGYIVIDQTEALTVIDVNTGKYVGKKDLEETITRTNLEAATEIAYQIRLRNSGGIIIIDFIDMSKASNKEKVYKKLEAELRKDRVKTTISKISELGLIEMTRKRTTESITRLITEPCPYCEGKGMVKSKVTIAYEVLRYLEQRAMNSNTEVLKLKASPQIVDILYHEDKSLIEDIEKKYKKGIVIEPVADYLVDQYEVED